MSHTAGKHHARGFTLLELLMATALMSILALALYSAIQIAFKARSSAIQSIAPAESAELAMSTISEDLESALWPTGTFAGAFIGDVGSEVSTSDQLEFYAVLPSNSTVSAALSNTALSNNGVSSLVGTVDPTAYAGVCRIDILVRQLSPNEPPVLVRQITRNLQSPTVSPFEEQVLCRGVRAFTAVYVDAQQNQNDRWDSTQQGDALPLCVVLNLEMEPPATTAPGASAAATYKTTRYVTLACYRDTSAGGAP